MTIDLVFDLESCLIELLSILLPWHVSHWSGSKSSLLAAISAAQSCAELCVKVLNPKLVNSCATYLTRLETHSSHVVLTLPNDSAAI